MSDDITFCGSECNNKKCFRHPSNIAEPNIPHSFAYLKDTDMCPMKKQEIRYIDADALKKVILNLPNDNPSYYYTGDLLDRERVLDEIDNAPTVELTEEQAIDKLHETGWLIRHDKEMTERPQGKYVDISKLRLMKVEECAGHTIDYAMGWKACIEWIKKGGAE